MEDEPKVKSLQKALNILDCFNSKTPELGVSEIARMLGLNKSNVHNILSTLESSGYVKQNGLSEKYMLGNKMLEFSYTVMSSYKYSNTILPVMEQLADELNTVVYFGIPHGDFVLYLFATYPAGYANVISYRSIMGEKAPFYCTSIGKALLIAMDEDEIKTHLLGERIKYTPNTLTDDAALMADLAESKERGYAIDNIEHEPNVRCVGVPVLDRNMNLIGALSATGPLSIITTENVDSMAQKLLSAAFQIRARI